MKRGVKFDLDCVQCVTRQLVDAVKVLHSDWPDQKALIQEALQFVGSIPLDRVPVAVVHDTFEFLRQRSGVEDPYRATKSQFNNFVLQHYDSLEAAIANSEDPLHAALLLSIAGNVIDLAVVSSVRDDAIHQAVRTALEKTLPRRTLEAFRDDIARAERILYLADNSGEIVFDKLLIRRLPREKITYVVRGKPILNDCTMDDARHVGMTQLVDVIDNGAGAPGTVIDLCSQQFLDAYDGADCIIAKGMGNLETLFESPKNIYFLLQAKCGVLSRFLDVPVGTYLFVHEPASPG